MIMITMMKVMLKKDNIKNTKKYKKIKKKESMRMIILKNNNYNNNKQNTYNRQNTYRGRKKNDNTNLLHPNYEDYLV